MVKMPRNCRLSRMIDNYNLFVSGQPLGVCISYQPQEVTRSSVEEITVNIRFLLGTNRFVCYMHFLHLVKEISLSQGTAGSILCLGLASTLRTIRTDTGRKKRSTCR